MVLQSKNILFIVLVLMLLFSYNDLFADDLDASCFLPWGKGYYGFSMGTPGFCDIVIGSNTEYTDTKISASVLSVLLLYEDNNSEMYYYDYYYHVYEVNFNLVFINTDHFQLYSGPYCGVYLSRLSDLYETHAAALYAGGLAGIRIYGFFVEGGFCRTSSTENIFWGVGEKYGVLAKIGWVTGFN